MDKKNFQAWVSEQVEQGNVASVYDMILSMQKELKKKLMEFVKANGEQETDNFSFFYDEVSCDRVKDKGEIQTAAEELAIDVKEYIDWGKVGKKVASELGSCPGLTSFTQTRFFEQAKKGE